MYKATVIIAFYNKTNFLQLVFAGLERQTEKNFEVLIADDGSNVDSVDKLKKMIHESSFDVQHVWHEDKGWRKNIILNKSILKSKSEQIIFIDADCIPHEKFVAEHIENSQSKTILTGRRANISEGVTLKLTPERVKKGDLEHMKLTFLIEGLSRKTRHMEKAFYIKSKLLRRHIQKKNTAILGCNFSMNKSDLLDLNGFDERYLSPACGEDTDLDMRGRFLGLDFKSVNHMAIQYHLYHKTLPRGKENLELLEENRRNKVTFTPYGLFQDSK
ncbi:MAG: glycosyltransferase involved in cell wall biosynthesis [Cyclobacteriaceae bacterium]|jgi:glycosyltransferase involved in cell wall biosynthesis